MGRVKEARTLPTRTWEAGVEGQTGRQAGRLCRVQCGDGVAGYLTAREGHTTT